MFQKRPSPASRQAKLPRRRDERVIIHFDYDCFYAACFEVERPELSSLPLAVQQKQIIVTCNYEARKRGLYKLQLITEARKACPEVIIVLGEDLTRFRNHSKDNYAFLKQHIWSGRAERLGFDEVWLDVTDMVDYNISMINATQLHAAWFCLSKEDPTQGFSFDASGSVGGTFPKGGAKLDLGLPDRASTLQLRLILGSHLAFYIRKQLEEKKGFTSTVGISTNKVLSKLVGNLNKPRGQTTLLPPYGTYDTEDEINLSNVQTFLDSHEIGQIPGIGHKGSQQIRSLVKGHEVGYVEGLVTHNFKEKVIVREARLLPGIGPELLEETLGGPGAPKGIGGRTWELLNGVDDSDVAEARDVPRQISIEDTYLHMHDLKAVKQQLVLLSISLIKRLRLDLTESEPDDLDQPTPTFDEERHASLAGPPGERLSASEEDRIDETHAAPVDGQLKPISSAHRRWLAHPRTLRLSTRERKPQRSFARISRSSPMPNFIFNLEAPIDQIATKLADESLLPMFTKLLPGRSSGFDVNLINIAATNMLEAAGERSGAVGRDIAGMFKNQERVLKEWRVEDRDVPPDDTARRNAVLAGDGQGERSMEEEVDLGAEVEEHPYSVAQGDLKDYTMLEVSGISHDQSSRVQHNSHGLPHGSESGVARPIYGSEDHVVLTQSSAGDDFDMGTGWESDGEGPASLGDPCPICGALMPSFAIEAHLRYHREPD